MEKKRKGGKGKEKIRMSWQWLLTVSLMIAKMLPIVYRERDEWSHEEKYDLWADCSLQSYNHAIHAIKHTN